MVYLQFPVCVFGSYTTSVRIWYNTFLYLLGEFKYQIAQIGRTRINPSCFCTHVTIYNTWFTRMESLRKPWSYQLSSWAGEIRFVIYSSKSRLFLHKQCFIEIRLIDIIVYTKKGCSSSWACWLLNLNAWIENDLPLKCKKKSSDIFSLSIFS